MIAFRYLLNMYDVASLIFDIPTYLIVGTYYFLEMISIHNHSSTIISILIRIPVVHQIGHDVLFLIL